MVISQKSRKNGRTESLESENLPHLKGVGRRERRAAETRLRLFRCALQLFSERGFPNVTVEDITEAADVGKGTFFNYFPNKESVLLALIERQRSIIAAAVEKASTSKSVRPVLLEMARAKSVDMPIAAAIAAVLAGQMNVDQAIESLLTRPLRAED